MCQVGSYAFSYSITNSYKLCKVGLLLFYYCSYLQMSGSGTLSELSKLFILLEVGQDKDLNSSECDYKPHTSTTPVCPLPKAYKNNVCNL